MYATTLNLPEAQPITMNISSIARKAKKIVFLLNIGFLFTDHSYILSEEPTFPAHFSENPQSDRARELVFLYPEILWLADAQVRATNEGSANEKNAYSEQLFGQKFIEFDRTLMTLHCLQLILQGDENAYLQFTHDQPEEGKLLPSSFSRLHARAEEFIESGYENLSKSEWISAMEAALVMGDIGKSEKARLFFKPYGASAPDHDDFHGEVMQILEIHPDLSPTFNRLTSGAKKLLVETANLAHYGHITHLEGGPGMFSTLKASNLSSTPRAFDFFIHLCDIAGALGHVNNRSSLVLTENTFLATDAVFEACMLLSNPEKNEKDAYLAYLKTRATLLGLDCENREDRVLTRAGAMLRLFTPEDGVFLKQAFYRLPLYERSEISDLFDSSEAEEFKRTPTYMPAVLVNLFNHPGFGSSKEERLAGAVTVGLPFLTAVLKSHRNAVKEGECDPNIPLNFNEAAGIAKVNPIALLNRFDIDPEGNVRVVR